MFIRRLPRFEYHAPTSVPEALELLSAYNGNARVFAGGTDLFVSMKKREVVPEHLINLKGIEELKNIHYEKEEGLRIGGLVTIGELERSTIVKEKFPALGDAVNVMAAPQVRNLATIGGNLCSAIPSADTAPPLIVLGATAIIVGSAGERTVLVENFFQGNKISALAHDEILKEIFIPAETVNNGSAYFKLMRRNAQDLALVGVASSLRFDGDRQTCQEARIALGAVAPTPLRALKAEAVLKGKNINDDLAAEAGRAASEEARPITDVRASKEYRREMVGVLTKRAILEALKRTYDKS
jgi:aerobic carbon-monoxide dehydrogenase medium subunit